MELSDRAVIWLMRLVCASAAFMITILSVFREMVMLGGVFNAYLLLFLITFFCGFYGPLFKKHWYGSIDQLIGASLLVAVLTNGSAWSSMIIIGVVFLGDPVGELWKLPNMFLSGGLLAPLTILLYPFSILVVLASAIAMVVLGKHLFRKTRPAPQKGAFHSPKQTLHQDVMHRSLESLQPPQ